MILIKNNKLFIGCGKNSIEVLELQLEGKKPMGAKTFINGYQKINGSLLN